MSEGAATTAGVVYEYSNFGSGQEIVIGWAGRTVYYR